jgi:predicted nucleic-acid-binding protein
MKIIIDTNVLLRFLIAIEVDKAQCIIAANEFRQAEEVIVPTHVLCEFVWVARSLFKLSNEYLAQVLALFLANESKLKIHEDEVEMGLKMLRAGGDFADGVNAYTGRLMTRGEAVFVSFDKQAVKLLSDQGVSARVP